jgi:hypothetical protein
MTVNVHFPEELLQPKRSGSTSKDDGPHKRLKRGPGNVTARLAEMERWEDADGEGGRQERGHASRSAQMEDAGEEEEEEEDGKEKKEDDVLDTDEEEEEEEEELFNADDYGGFGSENDMDDLDGSGDDEPTY